MDADVEAALTKIERAAESALKDCANHITSHCPAAHHAAIWATADALKEIQSEIKRQRKKLS